ncbi:hypothetical protein C1646_748924 [Rhizophagus diaphanus]|nr:hypothetical protein C1646_748924 [Rhizophagus diaphanus] [Rhizophagus sp. MUCL 43196]
MSHKRKELQQATEDKLIERILVELDKEDFIDSSEEEEGDSEIFILGLLALNEACYIEPRIYNIAKSQYWYNVILPSYDDIRFKKIMRMLPENFKALVRSKDDVFSICSRYGIAEGTVLLYCKLIMKAIISYKSEYIKWPTGQDRKFVHDGFEAIGGIENIIGAIDGTHFILQNAPQKEKYLYKKEKICFTLQRYS